MGGARLYCRDVGLRIYFIQMDSVSPEKRSWVMAQVKGRNTKPEKAVRSLLHRMGYRFRLQRKDLRASRISSYPSIARPSLFMVVFGTGTIALTASGFPSPALIFGFRSWKATRNEI